MYPHLSYEMNNVVLINCCGYGINTNNSICILYVFAIDVTKFIQ